MKSNNIQKTLFDLEKFFFVSKDQNIKSLFITVLARSGTTILLNTLYDTGKFGSLKYSDIQYLVKNKFCEKVISKK